ncbi:MAG TPA: tRNA (guanosine(46)-N7)-methyltransferase TrmB [Micromonosporaceae bacterium]
MSPTAADALARLWASRGFDIDETTPVELDRTALFGRYAPLVLEIGCGMGEAMLAMAAADPARDYLGVDVHTPGLGAILARAETDGIRNVAVARGDAVELLRHGVGPASLDAINVFFPDPWPKARHHKRRLIRPEIVALMRDRLRPGGVLHAATDWVHYAEQMRDVLTADPGLRNMDDGDTPRPPDRPPTKFERRGIAAGRSIHDLVFVRSPGSAATAVGPAPVTPD